MVFRGALLSLCPSAAPVRVPALREGMGRFGGFVEPRPAGMSARSRLRLPDPSGPVAPAARHPGPRHPVFLRVRFVVKARPRVAWTLLKRSLPLPGGFGCSGVSPAVPGTRPAASPHPPARARGTILALSRRLHLGFSVASGYAFFPGRSPEHSSSSQRARLPLFPESSPGVAIQALSSARVRAWV